MDRDQVAELLQNRNVSLLDLRIRPVLDLAERLHCSAETVARFRQVFSSTAPALLTVDQDAPKVFSSGIPHFDRLLNGGFHTGEVTELVGASATGKTCTALTFALAVQLQDNRDVLLVSRESDVSLRRLRSLQPAFPTSGLDRIRLPTSSVSDPAVFYDLLQSSLVLDEITNDRISTIILDTIPFVKDRMNEFQIALDNLRALCIKHKVVLIIINGLVSSLVEKGSLQTPRVTGMLPKRGSDWVDRPRLGLYLARRVDTRILLSRTPYNRRFQVVYSQHARPGLTFFDIAQSGITDATEQASEDQFWDDFFSSAK